MAEPGREEADRRMLLLPDDELRAALMRELERYVGPNLDGWPAFPIVYFGGLADRVYQVVAAAVAARVRADIAADIEREYDRWAPLLYRYENGQPRRKLIAALPVTMVGPRDSITITFSLNLIDDVDGVRFMPEPAP